MSIALPTILILLAIIPAVAFLGSYYSGNLPRQIAPVSPLAELALFFVLAIPLDMLVLWLIHQEFHPNQIRALGLVLQGDADRALDLYWPTPNSYNQRSLASCLTGYGWIWTALKYLSVVLGASLAGVALRRFFLWARFDLLPIGAAPFRVKNDLYYYLLGRVPGFPREVMPVADVLVDLGGKTKLYRGVVGTVMFNKEGDLDNLVLLEAQRGRPKARDSHKSAADFLPGEATHWTDIPGHIFIVRGPSILSINMSYLVYPVASDSPPVPEEARSTAL